MKAALAFVAMLLSLPCHGGGTSYSLVVAAQRANLPGVAVKLEVPAEYVAVPVSISSNEKDPLRNLDNVQLATSRIVEAISKNPRIRIRQGVVSLSASQGEDGMFSSYRNAPSSSNLFLVSPLSKDRDVFQIVREITALAQTVQRNDQIRVSFGAASLGIEDPERYREQLLSLIRKDVEKVRSALGAPRSYEISGLANPVAVVQKDDQNVFVFILYSLKAGQ